MPEEQFPNKEKQNICRMSQIQPHHPLNVALNKCDQNVSRRV